MQGTIAGCSDGNQNKFLTQIELWENEEWQVIRDEASNAAGVCAGAASSALCNKYSWLTRYEIDASGDTVYITVEEADFNNFDNKLAEDVTFRFRMRTRDFWSTDASNPLY